MTMNRLFDFKENNTKAKIISFFTNDSHDPFDREEIIQQTGVYYAEVSSHYDDSNK